MITLDDLNDVYPLRDTSIITPEKESLDNEEPVYGIYDKEDYEYHLLYWDH